MIEAPWWEYAIPGRFSYGPRPAFRIAAVALWWRSVINIAAVSRSTIPSLLASICSRADVSMGMAVLEGPGIAVVLGPARRFTSLWRGMPPSFACTVRSCRSNKSRRTKVLLHFMHLKGRSFVSAADELALRQLIAMQQMQVARWRRKFMPRDTKKEGENGDWNHPKNLRDLSCLLRCSLLLKALLQNWHLYFFSGASDDFLIVDDDAVVGSTVVMLATGILAFVSVVVGPGCLSFTDRWLKSSGSRAWA